MESSNFDRERLKLSENEVAVDRISNLPDHVLCLILSFLETQQSVQTCILSKRWRFLWLNVNNLNFKCRVAPPLTNSITCFEKLVTMAMLLHKSQSLRHFSLTWNKCANPFIITASLSTAISRNVRFLHLSISSLDGKRVALPSSLFTCKSLDTLILIGDFLVEVPVLVSLPKLDVLILFSVKYKCSKTFEKLIEGCPILVVLLVYVSDIYSLPRRTFPEHMLEINAPALKILHIADSDPDLLPLDLTFQSLNSFPQEISGTTAQSNENFKSLTKLTLSTRFLTWELFLRLLEKTAQLQVLKLELEEPSYLSGSHDIWKDDTPRCLCSSLRRISISDFKEAKDVVEMIKYFLQNGEFLERVELHPCTEIAVSKKYDLLKKVSAIRRKSTACEVLVLD